MKKNYKEISSCEVCGKGFTGDSVLNLGMHALCDDLVAIGEVRSCEMYPIEIYYCSNCGTAHQRFQVPKTELFKGSYHYRARFTADVLNGMKEFVASCKNKCGNLIGKKVLDIGCNDGSLLNIFKQEEAITFGVEPTEACEEARTAGHIAYKEFINIDLAQKILEIHGKQDFITFTNVFAHIENLDEVLSALKILMHDNTFLVIENHYLGAVLNGNQFDTFYHEHPRTYSYKSFSFIAKSLGMTLLDVEFPARYGGNIRVFLGGDSCNIDAITTPKNNIPYEGDFSLKFDMLAKKVASWRLEKREYLKDLSYKFGKLNAKAFPGRAAILVKLLNLDESIFEAIYEKPGSLKVGHYVPGTRIPILSDDLLDAGDKRAPLINMAWHIPSEIRAYLDGLGYEGEVEDILSQDYFKS